MLEEARSSLERVVRVGVYLATIGDFGEIDGLYSGFFPKQPPGRTTLVVSKFPAGIKL
jgi:2-iminobutanoate/2-iminopropanoate deaminase